MKRVAVLLAFVLLSVVAALAPPSLSTQAQGNCFSNGFCITNPAFAEYFRVRGSEQILGFPVSRSFTLEGFEVQIFQRVVLQMNGGQVARLNLLDTSIMPMTQVNQSIFPPNDPALAQQAPSNPSAPTYARDVVQFVQQNAPDTFNGQPVGFFTKFNTTVPVGIAFPSGNANPDLVTLSNLEIWGVPTSRPAADPGNGGFIYQRFQRGIMHYRANEQRTDGILVGEYFKFVITGQNLPTDLAQQMQGSRYLNQYDPSKVNWLARPGELPSTDLTGAFETGTGAVQPGTGQGTTAPPAGATATATGTAAPSAVGPTVTLQVDDERIDPGQTVNVTVIARYATGIDWIEFEGVEGTRNNANDNAATDQAFARQRFDCDDRTECANVWSITPGISGDYTLRARSRGTDGVRSDWVTLTMRVRGNATATATGAAATATPTTAAATATATTAAATPAAATATTAAATPTATTVP